MKAIVFEQPGEADVLRLGVAEAPSCGPTDLLIDVYATAVNRADVLQRRGFYPPPPGASPILGLEVAGTIREIGSQVQGWQLGERVCALLAGGGYAEQVAIPASLAMRVPDHLSLIEAAAIPEVWTTAYDNLFNWGRLAAGETVLLHGGGSGIGTAGIQLAKQRGARVLVTAGSTQKIDRCLELGADAGINYHEDWVAQARALTSGRGVNVVLDIIGAKYLESNLSSLADEGRLVIIGLQGGVKTEINLQILMQKRLSIQATTLRARSVEAKAQLARQLERDVLPLFAQGIFKPIIDQVLPLAHAAQAHQRLESSAHFGKLVLQVRDE